MFEDKGKIMKIQGAMHNLKILSNFWRKSCSKTSPKIYCDMAKKRSKSAFAVMVKNDKGEFEIKEIHYKGEEDGKEKKRKNI